jgi:hypothetical protein
LKKTLLKTSKIVLMYRNSLARHFFSMFHAKCLLPRLDWLLPVRSCLQNFYQWCLDCNFFVFLLLLQVIYCYQLSILMYLRFFRINLFYLGISFILYIFKYKCSKWHASKTWIKKTYNGCYKPRHLLLGTLEIDLTPYSKPLNLGLCSFNSLCTFRK